MKRRSILLLATIALGVLMLGGVALAQTLPTDFTVATQGENLSQCTSLQGIGQTGNAVAAPVFSQYANDLELAGDTFEVGPAQTFECVQEVNQALSAGG